MFLFKGTFFREKGKVKGGQMKGDKIINRNMF